MLAHARSAWNGFTNWDDTAYVTTNPLVKSPSGLSRIWASNDSPQYYPLTFSLYDDPVTIAKDVPTSVPEPASLMLVGSGLVAMWNCRKRS